MEDDNLECEAAADDEIEAVEELNNFDALMQQISGNSEDAIDQLMESANLDITTPEVGSAEYTKILESLRLENVSAFEKCRREGGRKAQADVENEFFNYCKLFKKQPIVSKVNLLESQRKSKRGDGILAFQTIKKHVFGLVRLWNQQSITDKKLKAEGNPYDADIKILLKRHARQCVAERVNHRRFIDVVRATSLDNRYTMQNRIDIILRSFMCSDSSRIFPGIGLRNAFMFAFLAQTGLRGEEVRNLSWLQFQPYTFRHGRSLEHKGMVAILFERKYMKDAGIPKEIGILFHRDPKVCALWWFLLKLHYDFEISGNKIDWTNQEAVFQLMVCSSGKTLTTTIGASSHYKRLNKVLQGLRLNFSKSTHLGRSNCCRDLQDLGVATEDIKIGLGWANESAEISYMHQIPYYQVCGSAGYSPNEVYDPHHLKINVPDRFGKNVFEFAETALQENEKNRGEEGYNGIRNFLTMLIEFRNSFLCCAAVIIGEGGRELQKYMSMRFPTFCTPEFIEWALNPFQSQLSNFRETPGLSLEGIQNETLKQLLTSQHNIQSIMLEKLNSILSRVDNIERHLKIKRPNAPSDMLFSSPTTTAGESSSPSPLRFKPIIKKQKIIASSPMSSPISKPENIVLGNSWSNEGDFKLFVEFWRKETKRRNEFNNGHSRRLAIHFPDSISDFKEFANNVQLCCRDENSAFYKEYLANIKLPIKQ